MVSSRKKIESSEPINIDESEIYDDFADESVESDAEDFGSWGEEEFDETDYEALPPASLPPRSGKSGKVTSKTVSTPAHESAGVPKRWVLPAAIGGGVILLMTVIAVVLMASGIFKSDYEKLHDVWYEIVHSHLRTTQTQKTSSEVSEEAEKAIADIQAKIDPASYFNVLLPESRRKPVVIREELKRVPDLKSLLEGMKQDAKARTTKELLIAFDIEIYPWLIPVLQRIDAGTASEQEKFLFDALMLHRLFRQLT